MYDGFLEYVAPYMRRVQDLSEPNHQEAHIHHAHWYRTNPGDPTDNYFHGNAEWIFGQGDEQTHADFRQRSQADPNGPEYGEFIPKGDPQDLIYMLHNKTDQPLNVYIVLDVEFRNVPAAGDFPEHYPTSTTPPAWRAPLHKGDRIVLDSSYGNSDHGWYEVMTHEGMYLDPAQPPQGRCKPYMVGGLAKKWKDPTKGVPNRPWGMDEKMSGTAGYPPCAPPAQAPPPPPGTPHACTIPHPTTPPGC